MDEIWNNPLATFAGGSLLTIGLGVFIRSIVHSNRMLVSETERLANSRTTEQELWHTEKAEMIAYWEAREARLQQRIDDLETELARWQDRVWNVATRSLTIDDYLPPKDESAGGLKEG